MLGAVAMETLVCCDEIIELRFVTPVSTLTASFHGDTNGLASIAVVGAVDKVRLIVLVPRILILPFT